MGEALWADLDQWQIDHLFALLGPDGSYNTLVCPLVIATIVRDYREWNNPDVWQFPAIIVAGARVTRPVSGLGIGGGLPHYRKPYTYSWLAVVEGDSFTAERDAKILEKRLETAGRQLVANGWGEAATIPLAPDSSGERLSQIVVGESNIARFPRVSNTDNDAWYGVVAMDIDFIGTV